MSGSENKKKFPYRELLYKTLILVATVALIVYFLPREGKFNYQFDLNKPWKYGLLTASFDFPIYKDEAAVKKEQDSLLAHFQPYFAFNKEVEASELEKLRKNNSHPDKRNTLPANYVRHIEKLLKEIYSAGIVSGENKKLLDDSHTSSIMIVERNMATPYQANELFTVKRAYEYLLNADSVHFSKSLLRQFNLNEYITPNLIYDEHKSVAARKELLNNISWASGLVLSGQKIIDRGEIIDNQTYNILESLRKESIKRSESAEQKRLILIGQILFVSIITFCFMFYLWLYRKDYYEDKRTLLLLFTLLILYPVLTAIMVGHNLFNVYILPYAMLAIIIRVFLDSRTAFMALTTMVLLCSITLRYPYEFILLQITAGTVAIYSLRELSQRSQLFKSVFLIVITYALLYFSYELIQENDIAKINLSMYTYFAVNGVLLLFTYPLLFLLEKLFGFTSNVTLVELSNINNPLLRKMSEVVPGTFQHSMQVANLAAEAANRIGAKAQLVRTGALYHDIGKMETPAFFTENQSGINPHKSLGYKQSAEIVINHITNGLKLADKNNLPKAIKDFIVTHHGLGKTKYFYISYKNDHPGQEIDESLFSYPGPNPFTKETAILMMADGVEAASRSLPEYTEESIGNLVDKIIDSQVSEGYFKECPITFKDIAEVKSVFKEKLKTMYHTRISYPELKKP